MKFKVNDLVMLKDVNKYDIPSNCNILRVTKRGEKKEVFNLDSRKGELHSVPLADIKAIPIDGQSDADIYLFKIEKAAVLKFKDSEEAPKPIRKEDYSYYYDRLKDNKKIQEHKPKYVHEVQRLLDIEQGLAVRWLLSSL